MSKLQQIQTRQIQKEIEAMTKRKEEYWLEILQFLNVTMPRDIYDRERLECLKTAYEDAVTDWALAMLRLAEDRGEDD